ncbi:MFS transporter [Curtobacterium sp. 18060]|uniref:MFS transporter n=1 Tax=Curtobacterium sp. 18060 TaxID=2681408 RepID=UPI001356B203|nr:MFS transporter [Curtobacterium sp. 18060]
MDQRDPAVLPAPRAAAERIWNRSFTSAFATYFLINLGLNLSNVVISPYARDLGATPAVIGVVAAAFTIGSITFKLVSAPAIDTYNRKYLLLGAVAVIAIAFAGYAVSGSATSVLTFRIVQGAGQAFTSTTCIALAADTLPRRKLAAGLGVFALASGAAQMIGAPLALQIQAATDYRTTFSVAIGVLVLAAVAVLRIRPRHIALPVRRSFRLTPSSVIAREAIVPGALQFCFLFAWSLVNSFVVVYGVEQGLGSDVGYFFTVYGLVLFVASPLGGRAVDRFGYVAVLPMLACIVGSMYLISVSDTIWTLLAAAVVGAFGYGAAGPVARSMAMGVVPEERRGAASSTLYLGSDLGQLAGPVVGGLIATTLGYAAMFRIAPVSILVAAAILLLARRTLEHRRTELVVREETGSIALVDGDRR